MNEYIKGTIRSHNEAESFVKKEKRLSGKGTFESANLVSHHFPPSLKCVKENFCERRTQVL